MLGFQERLPDPGDFGRPDAACRVLRDDIPCNRPTKERGNPLEAGPDGSRGQVSLFQRFQMTQDMKRGDLVGKKSVALAFKSLDE